MPFGKKVRDCDKFGAQVHLTYQGKSQSGTLCGGVVSVGLSILILAYFCIRSIAVTQYKDPAINSYIVFENRGKMKKALNLADYG